MYEQRAYQEVLIKDIIKGFNEEAKLKLMVQLATGGGKTYIFSKVLSIIHESIEGKVVIMVHRERLVSQISDTLSKLGVSNIIIDSHSPPVWTNKKYKSTKVFVCMIQTLSSRIKNSPDSIIPPNDVSFIICDEAHRICADMYINTLKYYQNAKFVSFTATPVRSDGKVLADVATSGLLQGPSVKQLQSIGALCGFVPYKVHAIPYNDLKQMIKESKSQKSLDKNMGNFIAEYDVLPKVYKFWKNFCQGKPTIIFASDRLQGIECKKLFESKGVKCAYVDSKTDRRVRDDIEEKLPTGEYDVFINVLLATEGYDAPLLEACLILRSSYSLGLYLQMVGRVLRKYALKPDKEALIADFGGNIDRFGLPDKEHEWSDYFYGRKKPSNFFGNFISDTMVEVDMDGEKSTKRNTGKLVSSMVKSLANQVSDKKLKDLVDKHSTGEISLDKLAEELIKLRREIPESKIVLSYLKKNSSFESVLEFNRKVSDKAKMIVDKSVSSYSKDKKDSFIDYFNAEFRGIPTVFDVIYAAKKLSMSKEDALSFCYSVGFQSEFVTEVVSPYTELTLS